MITGDEKSVQEIIEHVENDVEHQAMAKGTNYYIDFRDEWPEAQLAFVKMMHEAFNLMRKEENRGTIWLTNMLHMTETWLQEAHTSLAYWQGNTQDRRAAYAIVEYTNMVDQHKARIIELNAILARKGTVSC